MNTKPLKLEAEEAERTRVCEIRRIPNVEHMMRCRVALSKRDHPAWSQHHVSFRITPAKRLRAVR